MALRSYHLEISVWRDFSEAGNKSGLQNRDKRGSFTRADSEIKSCFPVLGSTGIFAELSKDQYITIDFLSGYDYATPQSAQSTIRYKGQFLNQFHQF